MVPGGAEAEWEKYLAVAGDNAAEISTFVKEAREKHGEVGERAAVFLVKGMRPMDLKNLKGSFLLENLALAFKAREEFLNLFD